ncbi:hypothetical protein FSP39_010146 [Pinctada imbricata]|uniref:C2H2-type domain-containing protein n=1 Tax=Pinctada imbricata TaxID=66713 RepID=A0AA89C554_PINIB|nr:hypothetical protein FSP39_010146 [Pinctada imbricata]
MDIGCGMEFQFPVSNHLPEFGETASGIHDKLDLGPGQLLDSVSVTAPCADHDGSDKHLTAADFKLDLGPANDLVSSVDFHLETSVSDISSESTVSEECSEGYSIVNTALEGGTSVPKHTIPVSCALNLGNVTNVQTIQLNQVNLSTMQSMQVIPIQNMQILSSVRPVQNFNRIQTVNTADSMKMGIPGLVNTSTPSAVLLGNVLLLQTVPRQVSVCHGGNIISAGTDRLPQNQIVQILNTQNNTSQFPSPTPLLNQRVKLAQTSVKVQPSYSPDATVSSILKNRDGRLVSPCTSYNHDNEDGVPSSTSSFTTDNIPCENVMSLNANAVAQQINNCSSGIQGTDVSENETQSQKNTKILVYGKNIALTFDCRNQKNVMNSIAKAMSSPPTVVTKEGVEDESIGNNEDVFSSASSKTLENSFVDADKQQNIENNLQNIKNPDVSKASDTCATTDLINDNTENQSAIEIACQKLEKVTNGGSSGPGLEEGIQSYHTQIDNTDDEPHVGKRMKLTPSSSEEKNENVVISVSKSTEMEENDKGSDYTFSCDLCSATFNRQGNYTRHRMIHTIGGKDSHRYKCPECERTFLQRCDMKRHMLIHTNQQPYKCSVCGKGDLNRHIRSLHQSASLLKCGHCNRQYSKEATLIRHMQTAHSDIIQKSLQEKYELEHR